MSEEYADSTGEASTGEAALPKHFRHNFVAFMVDYISFGVAFSFINLNTVMPAFIRTLTNSEPLIGLVGTVFNAGWLWPQLGAAAMMRKSRRKKPYLLGTTYFARPLFLLLALAIWAGLTRHATAMLTTLFACITLFTVLDSVAAVAWFDMLGRAIPMARRGRLLGMGQVISSLLGIAVGVLVGVILDSPNLLYPTNYALLFGLSSIAHIPSVIALSTLREPEDGNAEPQRTLKNFVAQLSEVWRKDLSFRRLMGHRWLVDLMGLAMPFFVLHAIEVVGLPPAATGWFVAAEKVGGIVSSVGLGWLSERKGPRPVIWVGTLCAFLAPLLALGIHFFPFGLLSQTYPLVFFLLGITHNSWMLGPLNYLLEMSSEEKRSLYVGLYNTMSGLLVPASFLGGFLLQATSYPVLFGVTAVGVGIGLRLSLRIRPLGKGTSS